MAARLREANDGTWHVSHAGHVLGTAAASIGSFEPQPTWSASSKPDPDPQFDLSAMCPV